MSVCKDGRADVCTPAFCRFVIKGAQELKVGYLVQGHLSWESWLMYHSRFLQKSVILTRKASHVSKAKDDASH